jgi:hypothetical protein
MARTVVSTDNPITVKHQSTGVKKRKIRSFSNFRKARRKRYG